MKQSGIAFRLALYKTVSRAQQPEGFYACCKVRQRFEIPKLALVIVGVS